METNTKISQKNQEMLYSYLENKYVARQEIIEQLNHKLLGEVNKYQAARPGIIGNKLNMIYVEIIKITLCLGITPCRQNNYRAVNNINSNNQTPGLFFFFF